MADTSKSDAVRLDATQWLAGLEGVTPVARSEHVHLHEGMPPGLVIVLADPERAPAIEGHRAAQSQLPGAVRVGGGWMIGQSVPHPSLVKKGDE